jgi:RNA polymerase sigma-70 factor (ECF subfamily)
MANKTNDEAQARTTLDSLLDSHGRELHAYLWRMLGDPQDAEDCLQDTFLRAFRAFNRTNEDWNYRAWLYKIATNVARTHMKRDRRHSQVQEGLIDHKLRDPLESIALREQFTGVLTAMEQLSFRQRTAIMLRKYSELDYEEIGEALECSPETARAHVYQGLKRLRERLATGVVLGGQADA